jgi:alpha-galactosidase
VTPRYRRSSDGNLQSAPLAQQLFVSVDGGCEAEVLFFLSPDSVCMRPQRARSDEAILGQVGRPLLYGVSGLYDITRDILISWSSANWRWIDQELWAARYDRASAVVVRRQPEEGTIEGLCARMTVELSSAPWYVDLRYLYYREHLGYAHHAPWERRPHLEPVTGWCSWEAFHKEVSAQSVGEAVEFLRANLLDYGLEYIQIDDGYQRTPVPPTPQSALPESWLVPNEKFPGGHEDIRRCIVAAGFTAGIWTSAYVTNKEFAARDGNCLLDREGSPLEGDWIGCVPSCSPAFLARQVEPTYRGLRDLGYGYFKVDTLRHLLYDGLMDAAQRGLLQPEEARARFRRYVSAVRSAVGRDTFLLSCWGVLGEVVGLCDGCRIATDASPSWASLVMQIRESARWFPTQRILFQNDPDHVCARADVEWARSLLSFTSLTGGMLMLSDAVENYDGERLELIRKTIPAQPVMTAETGLLQEVIPAYPTIPSVSRKARDLTLDDALSFMNRDGSALHAHPFSSLWSVHYATAARRWTVAGRFAIVPLSACEVDLDALGLDPSLRYHAFDFWEQRYLGVVHGKLKCRDLSLGSCQIIGMAPWCDRPAYLADSRHVSFGLGFVLKENWHGEELLLDLRGVKAAVFSCWMTVPKRYSLAGVRAEGVTVLTQQKSRGTGLLRVDLEFQRAEGRLCLGFR